MGRSISTLFSDDARIFHREEFNYDWALAAKTGGLKGSIMTVSVKLVSGKAMKLSVQAVAQGVFRLKAWRGKAAFQQTSPMLLAPLPGPPKARFSEGKGAYTLRAGKHAVRVGKKPFTVELLDGKGNVLWGLDSGRSVMGVPLAPRLGFRTSKAGSHPFLSWLIHNDERLFGLGEKFNKVEKTGTRTTIWTADTCGLNTTDLAYKGVPVLFSTRGWAMMLHSSFRNYWEVGSFSYEHGSLLTEEDKLDLFLFAAPSLKGLLKKYTDLTGRPAMPPKWVFGVWMSRCTYKSRKELEAAAFGMRKRKIPCDVVHFDPPWMKHQWYPIIRVDACDFEWNEEDFPDRLGLFKKLNESNLSPCLWINPYIPEGTAIFSEARRKGYLVKKANGRVARNEFNQPVGMVDFTNPDAKEWWKDHLKALLRDGVAVFKPDYGERVPEDCVFHNGKTGAEMHNLYLMLYNQTVAEATREQKGHAFVWGRSGYIGSQRYAGTWAGDTQISWEAMRCCLRGGLSAGLSGFAFWSHDIGGFVGPAPPSPELYTRWAQWGLLCGLSRFHGVQPREPWKFGPRAEKIVTKYCRLRYRLMPYILAAAEGSCRTGLPMMRHMALEFPDEPNVDTLDDQYMFGPDLLVAPVMLEGARSRTVYLPAGTWTELERPLRVHEGPGFLKVAAPLNRMPVLVREGAIIPKLTGSPEHLKSGPARRIEVDVYPGERARSITFKDDTVRVRIRAQSVCGEASLSISPASVAVRARFLRVRAKEVMCNGARLTGRPTPSGTEVRL